MSEVAKRGKENEALGDLAASIKTWGRERGCGAVDFRPA
jgi:hypothetical protein